MPLASTAALLCFVVAVSDGDTLRARCEGAEAGRDLTVRITGIDAPESRQAYGRRARQALAGMTLHKPARLECQKHDDRYGRKLCQVWVVPSSCLPSQDCPMTLDAGHALLSAGLAWWDERFAHSQPREIRGAYEFSYQEARARHVGLWRDPDPVPPWLWRRFSPSPHGQKR